MIKKESMFLADFPLDFMSNMLGCIELLQWIWNIPKDFLGRGVNLWIVVWG